MPPFPITTSDWAWQSCAGMLEKRERERKGGKIHSTPIRGLSINRCVFLFFHVCLSLWAFTPVTPSQTERQDKIETTDTLKHHSNLPNLSFVLRRSIEFFTERLWLGAIVWVPQGKARQERSVVIITSAPAFSVSSHSSIDTEELMWMVQRTDTVKCHKCASYPTWWCFFFWSNR